MSRKLERQVSKKMLQEGSLGITVVWRSRSRNSGGHEIVFATCVSMFTQPPNVWVSTVVSTLLLTGLENVPKHCRTQLYPVEGFWLVLKGRREQPHHCYGI